jgi:hypothetical protein
MDISITVPGIGRIPVEIKPLYATRPSYGQLERFASGQLVGRYMRPASVECGIFLMVPLVKKKWQVDGRTVTFEEVQTRLAKYARDVAVKKGKEVVVASINVAAARVGKAKATSRGGRARVGAGHRPPGPSRRRV